VTGAVRPVEQGVTVDVEVGAQAQLRFDTGAPVRAASAIAPLGDGWLIAQDDATHAAWRRAASITAVRAFPPVAGHDTFSSAEGTKHLKPDVEAAVAIGTDGVLLLGSGSSPARTRASLVRLDAGSSSFTVADLTPVYAAAAGALDIPVEQLNLEGACLVGGRLRWFQRGNAAAHIDSAAVDVNVDALLAVLTGGAGTDAVPVGAARRYDFGTVDGVALAVTDALALPGGQLMVSLAAEDTPNAYDDGPVVGTALGLLDGDEVAAVAMLSTHGSAPLKIEGLALRGTRGDGVDLIGVVDADDTQLPSTELLLHVRW
jgi:hypothetical protein